MVLTFLSAMSARSPHTGNRLEWNWQSDTLNFGGPDFHGCFEWYGVANLADRDHMVP